MSSLLCVCVCLSQGTAVQVAKTRSVWSEGVERICFRYVAESLLGIPRDISTQLGEAEVPS